MESEDFGPIFQDEMVTTGDYTAEGIECTALYINDEFGQWLSGMMAGFD